MKFEDIVKKAQEVRAPDFKENQKFKNSKSKAMETLESELKNVDRKARLSIRFIQATYVFMISILFYFMISIDNSNERLGIGFIILSFFLVIIVQQLRYRKYNYTYTDNPVISYLKDAKERMSVITKRTWLVLPIWIFIDLGLGLIISSIFPYQEYILPLLILLQVVIVLLVAIDFYTAYVIWKKEQKPVVSEIDKMIYEIEKSK